MPAIYHEGLWLGNATDPEVLVKDTVGWTGKNRAYSQTNNAVIAHIENGITYDVSWTGSATVTLKKNSASGATITSGSTSPLSFTADADYELYFGSSATVTNIMVKDSRITDSTYEPYHESVEEVVEQIYADNGVLGAKNLLENKLSSKTKSGITVTVNSNKSVTLSGTNSSSSAVGFVLSNENDALGTQYAAPFKAGESYIFSGGGTGDPYDLQLLYKNGTYKKPTPNKPFILEADVACVYFSVAGNATVNATVYPMIRLASDPDDTYQPYAMTNRELTEDRYYHAGDTVDVTGSTFGAFISGGATEIVFTIPLLKDLSKINGISFGTTSRFSARTATGGYLFDTVNPNNYAVTIRKKVGNLLSLTIKKTDGSAFENGVNNSVLAIGFVTGSGQGSIITFS